MQTGCFLNNQEESYIIYIVPGGSSCLFVCFLMRGFTVPLFLQNKTSMIS